MEPLQKAKHLIEALSKDAHVIELAGPTPPGNEFLQNNKIHLVAKPLITNKENPAVFYGMPPYPKNLPVDEIADVRHLTYRGVDMFLCSYLTWFNDRQYNKKSLGKRLLACLHYTLGYTKSKANLHISLFRETADALKPNGLLLVEGIREEDFKIAKKCGFTLIHKDEDDAVLFQRSR
ncbi:MAG: hypothetical protein WBK76_01695 [Candidatus Saccharimonadales bacterium]